MALTAVASFIIQVGLVAASAVYQQRQQKKLQAKADAAADARKGFEIVSEGEITSLPLIYGRAKVGGVRTFADTASNFKYAPSSGQASFVTSHAATTGSDIAWLKPDGSGGWISSIIKKDKPFVGAPMSADMGGTNNSFLFVQQALCIGPIHAVHDVIIGDRDLSDPAIAEIDGATVKAALRIDAHYGAGVPCAMMAANFGSRATAKFTNAAYLSACVKLNRDEPQFQAVTDMQAFIEGALVRGINADGSLTAPRYSNNAVECLLDYLLHPYGGRLTVNQLDMASFYEGARIAGTVVLRNAAVGGKVWQSQITGRNVVTRDVLLYEANIMLDTTRPVRDNVGSLLTCIGDARLVWSQGRYKLIMQYPATNDAATVAGTLTDDDILLGSQFGISWPSSEERLNFVTVKYSDECANFNESTASWPPKTNGKVPRGTGVMVYPAKSGWDGNTDRERMLNNYGVWNGSGQMLWKVFAREAGAYVLTFNSVGSANVTINGVTRSATSGTASVTVAAGTVITITVAASGGGFAAQLKNPSGLFVWNSRSPAYQQMEVLNQTDTLYKSMLAEDNGVALETEMFLEGCTDYYHALAKAEETVRMSRGAFVCEFKYIVRGRFFEPGDLIRIDSDRLEIKGLLLRVEEARPEEGLVMSLKCSRFDAQFLAWNVADNQASVPTSPWVAAVMPPSRLDYQLTPAVSGMSSGKLSWPLVNDQRVTGYNLYFADPMAIDANGVPLFRQIGYSETDWFDLPLMGYDAGVFGVRSVANTGKLSALTVSAPVFLEKGPPPPTPVDVAVVASTTETRNRVTWTIPRLRTDGTQYLDHSMALVWRSALANGTGARCVGQSFTNSFDDTDGEIGNQYYWVTFVSRTGAESLKSAVVGPRKFYLPSQDVIPGAAVPPGPSGLVATPGFTTIELSWVVPTFTTGGGYRSSIVYAYKWAEGDTVAGPVTFLMETRATRVFITAEIGTKYTFTVRITTQEGGLSTAYAGPLTTATGLLNGKNIAKDAITADKIANGSIDESKFLSGLKAVHYLPSIPATKVAELISVDGKLYKWEAGKYVLAIDASAVSGKIGPTQISDSAIKTQHLTAGSVVADSLAANSVTAAAIAAGAVTADALAAKSIVAGSAVIANGAISNAMIADAAIDSAKIARAAIGSLNLTDWLESDAVGPDGTKVFRLNMRTGEMQMNSLNPNGTRTVLNNAGLRVIDGNGIVRIEIGDF